MTSKVRTNPVFAEFIDALVARVDDTVKIHMGRMDEHYPKWVGSDPVLVERIREFSVASMLAEYRCMREDSLPERCPPRDAEGARELARLGLPVDWMLTGFQIGHRCHWEAWLELVEGEVEDPELRRALLEAGSRFLFDYVERMSALVRGEYEDERQLVLRTEGDRRSILVHQLLNGAELDSESVAWPLEHHHLAILAWGPGGDAAARELAAALGRPVLIVGGGVDDTWYGWASAAAQLTPADESVIVRFRATSGRLALGLEASGVDGFRLSHRQARRAGWVAGYTDAAVTDFQDVALEGLAMEDADSARAFTVRELRGIDDDSIRSTRLRETLSAYFDSDQNAAAAAAALDVHQQTVANRIRAVEDLLGTPVPSRRSELELALRLRCCFEEPPSLQAGLQNDGNLP